MAGNFPSFKLSPEGAKVHAARRKSANRFRHRDTCFRRREELDKGGCSSVFIEQKSMVRNGDVDGVPGFLPLRFRELRFPLTGEKNRKTFAIPDRRSDIPVPPHLPIRQNVRHLMPQRGLKAGRAAELVGNEDVADFRFLVCMTARVVLGLFDDDIEDGRDSGEEALHVLFDLRDERRKVSAPFRESVGNDDLGGMGERADKREQDGKDW